MQREVRGFTVKDKTER
ncbi:hypothetical protein CL3_34150 [butyrate-producing bacterium SM4/1]|nr:hypothetical protein CLS_37970 [[Clostridium] cf. saccharolyticum K10]CBL37076.1 hypothetical protein CL3_34150 [butyrate-producing bacterium SM4/1]